MTELVDTEIKKSFIKSQPCFAPLTDEETNILASLLNEKHFTPGETIVEEGSPVDSVFFIVSGKADVRHVSIQNHETHIDSIATLDAGTADNDIY